MELTKLFKGLVIEIVFNGTRLPYTPASKTNPRSDEA
jgi:hypothetical protein